MYDEPIIFSPGGDGKDENQGYDAFVPLIDSGISLYVWTNSKFLSLIIYTCKDFDEEKAVEVTKEFWKIKEVEFEGF
jgi:S-adenosylmethionine/arginine decarboxylase-like enzyme